MAVARAGGLLTVTGTEADLRNLDVNAGALAQGGTQILFGQNPVRRLLSLKQARIILSGHLQIDPEKETLIISSDAPNGSGTVGANGAGGAVEIRSGGHLEVGTSDSTGSDGTTYSVGDAIVVARRGANASDVATAALYGLPGSSVTLRGCSLNTIAACRFDGAAGALAACVFRVNDVVWYNGRDQATSYFAPRLYTSDYRIDGLRMIGGTFQIQARAAGSYIRNIAIERMGGGVSITGGNFGALTDFFELKGVDGNHGSTTDVSVFNGMKARVTNSRTGSGIKADLQALNHPGRAFGCLEVRQEVRLNLRNAAGAAVQGARVHLADTVAGRGAENWTAKNAGVNGGGSPSTLVNYTDQRTYSVLSDASGHADLTADGGILLASKVYDSRPASGTPHAAKAFAFRGKTNDDSDTFDIHVNSYGYLSALLSVVCKGTSRVDVDVTLVADPSITEANVATVAAYSGIAVDHATDTVTITAPFTLDHIYDWLKRDKTLAGSETHPTRAGMVAMASGTILDIGGYSIVVGNGGVLNPGMKFQSIESTATVSTTGTGVINVGYQDSAGKSMLVRLGAAQTALVYDTGGAATYVAPSAADTARITVPAASTLNITAKRVGYDYRKYSVNVAAVAEVTVDLPRNRNVDTAATVDGSAINTWREDAGTIYGGNIYFDNTAADPNYIRLGNAELTSRPALSRALFDRRLTSRAGLEATHDHDDSGGRAYEIRGSQIMIDERWLNFGRQPITVPPNPAQGDGTGSGTLAKIATFGLNVVQRDNLTTYTPSRTGTYFVVIDPITTPFSPTPRDLEIAAAAVAENQAVQDALAGAALSGIRGLVGNIEGDVARVRTDVGAVSEQIRTLPIDELLDLTTSLHNLPLGGAHIWNSGRDDDTFSVVGGAWQFDFEAARNPDADDNATLNLEGVAAFDLATPADRTLVMQITMRAEALTGEAHDVDPRISAEWVCGAGTSNDVRRTMGYMLPSHPVRVRATSGGLGPASVIEFHAGRPAASINITDGSISLNPIVSASAHVRLVITRVEFVSRGHATLDDFKADVSNLDATVSSRLAAADYTDPPAAADLSVLEGRLTAARATSLDNLSRLDATVSSRLATAGYTAPPSLAVLEGRLTAVRAGLLDNLSRLDTTISSRQNNYNPATPGEIAEAVWEAAIADYTQSGEMGWMMDRLYDRIDATISSRAPATAVETIRKVLLADIEVTDTNVIFSYDGSELARFSRRSSTTSADWSGGRE